MRKACLLCVFALLFAVAPAVAQTPKEPRPKPGAAPKPPAGKPPAAPAEAPAVPTTPTEWKSEAYRVAATFPAGWAKVFDEPRAAGAWIDLARFEEPRTKTRVTISYQASQWRTPEEMFPAISEQMKSDATRAILREETRAATDKRPAGIVFEYTYRDADGPRHSLVGYWLHLGRRYRLYADVDEGGWRPIAVDVEAIAGSLSLTGGAFAEKIQNYRDEPANFEIYFPETFRIRMPSGTKVPRVVFQSDKLGVGVWVYVSEASGTLKQHVDQIVEDLKEGRADVKKQSGPGPHPSLRHEAAIVEYEQKAGSNVYRYRETIVLYKKAIYRLVLVASTQAFPAGEQHYKRMVDSLTFIR